MVTLDKQTQDILRRTYTTILNDAKATVQEKLDAAKGLATLEPQTPEEAAASIHASAVETTLPVGPPEPVEDSDAPQIAADTPIREMPVTARARADVRMGRRTLA